VGLPHFLIYCNRSRLLNGSGLVRVSLVVVHARSCRHIDKTAQGSFACGCFHTRRA